MINETKVTINWWKETSTVARMYLCEHYFKHRDWEGLNNGQIMHMWRKETGNPEKEADLSNLTTEQDYSTRIFSSMTESDPEDFVRFELWLSTLKNEERDRLRGLYYPGQNLVEAIDWLKIWVQECGEVAKRNALNDAAAAYVESEGGEYQRMYGHHCHSFKAGANWQAGHDKELITELTEALEQCLSRISPRSQDTWDLKAIYTSKSVLKKAQALKA